MELPVRILKKYHRDGETGKVLGTYYVQQANGKKSWKTIKEFESNRLEAAQHFARNLKRPVPKDEIIKLWKS